MITTKRASGCKIGPQEMWGKTKSMFYRSQDRVFRAFHWIEAVCNRTRSIVTVAMWLTGLRWATLIRAGLVVSVLRLIVSQVWRYTNIGSPHTNAWHTWHMSPRPHPGSHPPAHVCRTKMMFFELAKGWDQYFCTQATSLVQGICVTQAVTLVVTGHWIYPRIWTFLSNYSMSWTTSRLLRDPHTRYLNTVRSKLSYTKEYLNF